MKLEKQNLVVDVSCWLFILLFIYAASNKLVDFEKFRDQLGKSPVLAPFIAWIPWVIPIIEIVTAISLCIKQFQLIGLYASFSLMVMFSTYIIVILNFSYYIPCSCGGILQYMSWGKHLIFNIIFVALGACAVLLYPHDKRPIAIEGEAENLDQSKQQR